MKVDVLLGLQWGDEGKGKIVDVLTPDFDVVARFQGGPNAGHTLEFNNKKFVLHHIPSGIFHTEKVNIIGNGMVVDPVIFKREIEGLLAAGYDLRPCLQLSKRAHLIIPSHRILDAASENAKGKTKIGSTLKGIGPTYMDKTGRNGLRIGDIISPNFKEKYANLVNKHKQILSQYDYAYDLTDMEKEWFEGVELMKTFKLIDSEYVINKFLAENKTILAEGAQGTLLDIDFGSYPFVTSSNTTCSGASSGMGIAPTRIGNVHGIFKAYCTRVGSGPFPTELFDNDGEMIRRIGNEFGSTTGRPRRCGWLDLVALKYAIMLNGVTHLIMTKADVLNAFETIKVAVAYEIDGVTTTELPFDMNDVEITPVYKDFPGWQTDVSNIKNFEELPAELKNYVAFIEKETGVKLSIISLGPDRSATLVR
jgi:adenylosuccinate synthase